MAFNYQAIINSINNFAAQHGLTMYAYTPNFKGVIEALDNLQNIQFSVEDGTIVNADVNANAAIAGTKIDPDFGSQTITTTGSVGIGNASPAQLLHLTSSGSNAFLQFSDSGSGGSAAQVRIGSNGNDLVVLNNTSSNTATERMRIDSQGRLNLGVADPGSSAGIFNCDINGTRFHLGFGTAFTNYYTAGSNGNHIFRCGTSEKARISSSGNIRIGTTSFDPNWAPKLQVSGTASDGTQGILIENYKPAITFKDISGGSPERKHIWADGNALYLGSGDSAQNAQLAINSSGKVGIGTTVPSCELDIENSSSSEVRLHIANTNSITSVLTSTGTSYSFGGVGASTTWLTTSGTKLAIGPYTAGTLQFINGGERMRIDSSGRMLVGLSSTVSDAIVED